MSPLPSSSVQSRSANGCKKNANARDDNEASVAGRGIDAKEPRCFCPAGGFSFAVGRKEDGLCPKSGGSGKGAETKEGFTAARGKCGLVGKDPPK